MRWITTLLVTLFFLFVAENARADHWAIVPATAPSPAHPKGTVIVIGENPAERDVASGQTLRRGPKLFASASAVASVVAGGETFVATDAGVKGDASDEVALWVMGSDLQPKERIAIGTGENPTLVAGGSYLAVGFYERHPPTKTFGEQVPRHLYRVALLDRATRQVVTQKVYGDPANLLSPQLNVEDHMLAIANGRLFVSLPLRHKAHLVASSLPALSTLAETDLANDSFAFSGSTRIAWYGDRLVAIGAKWVELSSDLAVLAERAWTSTPAPIRVAVDGTSAVLDGAVPNGVASARRAKQDSRVEHLAWAWGTALAIARRGEDLDAPTDLVVVP